MCQATMSNKAKIGSFMLLLQSWAWYRLLFLCLRMELLCEFSLIIWWDNPARHNSILVELEDIRLALDQEIEEDCHWSFLQWSRCRNSTEAYNSSSVRNVFHCHPKSSMTCTRSGLEEDWPMFHKKYIEMPEQLHLQITWIGSGITTSHIYYRL
ncbi:hypothetical protein PVK06_012448 [Gossypium arboreum]|uniref:Uncharacterized protein n=1 Tax=Gossypium arboreum TaxID=29729 RepID=A0ABR0QBL1_GOSAR|nr:hypothetical protein PVK06_012448 [Gossypium arboreum]